VAPNRRAKGSTQRAKGSVTVGPHLVAAPAEGLWRLGWATSPLHALPPQALDLADSRAGNRYDPIVPDFEVQYFGTTRAACYAETLAPRRPSPAYADLLRQSGEWSTHMGPGTVEAEWRRKRVLTCSLSEQTNERFLDISHHRSIAWLNAQLPSLLVALGFETITLSEVTQGDRRLTRSISSWLHGLRDGEGQPLFDGVRYPSRHGEDFECWAVFADRVLMRTLLTQTVELDDPDLKYVANLFGLLVF